MYRCEKVRVVYTCEYMRRFLSRFFFFFHFFFFLFSFERTAFLGVSKRARQRPRCDMRGAACNHLNQCTYTLYHSIIIYTGCTARTANVSRRYFIRKDSRRRFAFPRYPSISSVFLGPTHLVRPPFGQTAILSRSTMHRYA